MLDTEPPPKVILLVMATVTCLISPALGVLQIGRPEHGCKVAYAILYSQPGTAVQDGISPLCHYIDPMQPFGLCTALRTFNTIVNALGDGA